MGWRDRAVPVTSEPAAEPSGAAPAPSGGWRQRAEVVDAPAAVPDPGPQTPWYEGLGRGAVQGATLGTGDEIGGAARALPSLRVPQDRRTPGPRALARMYPGLTYPQAAQKWFEENRPDIAVANDADYARDSQAAIYRSERNKIRDANTKAAEEHANLYLAGQVGTGIPAAALTGGGALSVAGQGVAQGVGYSDSDTGTGLLSDAALGGAGGLAGYGVGQVVGKGLDAVRRAGARLIQSGTSRAAQQGAEEATAAVRSLEGAARERAANAYRQMERINLALADPALPTAERAALEAFKQSPEYAALLAANAKGVLGAAPEALAEREAATAIASQARADLPNAIQSRTGELLTTQAKPDLKSFLKAYAEPVVWGLGGMAVGNALGLSPAQQAIVGSITGSIGGRTRAGKAAWTRINRPAHQAAIGRALEGAAETALSPGAQRAGSGALRLAGMGAAGAFSPELREFVESYAPPEASATPDTGPQERYARTYGSRVPEEVAAWVSARTGGGE